jgi:hypothetical protein
MVSLARRVRTTRMCSLDARGKGPIQATLFKEYVEGGEKTEWVQEQRRDGVSSLPNTFAQSARCHAKAMALSVALMR